MNEEQVLKNRNRVAMSAARHIPNYETAYLVASYLENDKICEFFIPPIIENVAEFLQQDKTKDKEILFEDAYGEALFEVHKNFIGLCVKESEIVKFCTDIQKLLDKE